jgi:acetoacetate decarboxylase
LVVAFVAHYPEVASLFPYDESGLSLVCKYKGKIGMYWLSMTLTDDVGVFWGREIYGFPKKYGKIVFKKDGDKIEGSGSRRVMPFFSVKADLSKDANDPELNVILKKYGFDKDSIANFNFKELISTSGKSMDYFPRLTACWSDGKIHEQKFGHVEVELPNHPYDPWHEVEIKKLLGCMYEKKTTVLTAAKDLKKIGLFRILKYMPHMFKKYDLRK